MYTLDELKVFVHKCRRCSLCKSRTNVVFGEGNAKAAIMFVGEGPGFYEDKSGRPFVGRAGKLLDKMLGAVGFKREEVYITNIVKCRPPNNRNPYEEESEKCLDFLRWQVKIIDPSIIVCLGAVSAINLIDKDFRITQQRGVWYTKGKFNMIATYHPAALLRDETKKIDAWKDLRSIRKKYDEIMNNKI